MHLPLLIALLLPQPTPAPEALPAPHIDPIQAIIDAKLASDTADVAFQRTLYPPQNIVTAAIATADRQLFVIGLQLSCFSENWPGVPELLDQAQGIRDRRDALNLLELALGSGLYAPEPADTLYYLERYRAACKRFGVDPHGLLLPPTWPAPAPQ